jgi:hypothetical protein
MKLSKVCHHDIPEASDDVGDFLREAAFQSTGFHQGQHLSESLAELQRNGGAEGVVDAAVRRIERGAK